MSQRVQARKHSRAKAREFVVCEVPEAGDGTTCQQHDARRGSGQLSSSKAHPQQRRAACNSGGLATTTHSSCKEIRSLKVPSGMLAMSQPSSLLQSHYGVNQHGHGGQMSTSRDVTAMSLSRPLQGTPGTHMSPDDHGGHSEESFRETDSDLKLVMPEKFPGPRPEMGSQFISLRVKNTVIHTGVVALHGCTRTRDFCRGMAAPVPRPEKAIGHRPFHRQGYAGKGQIKFHDMQLIDEQDSQNLQAIEARYIDAQIPLRLPPHF